MWREAVGRFLKPSYWRFMFAFRSAITLCFVSLPWMGVCAFNTTTGFTLSPIIFGVWTFNTQQQFLGGNWRQGGKFLLMGCISTAMGVVAYSIPGVQDTILGSTIYIAIATSLIELLTMAKVWGLSKPFHVYMIVAVIDSMWIAKDMRDILIFWMVLSALIPCALVASSLILWPRPAIGRFYHLAAAVTNHITVNVALCQRLAFGEEKMPSAVELGRARAKVLSRLNEMDVVIQEGCKSELWLGNTQPLMALRKTLARGWFLVTVMNSLVMDSRTKHTPRVQSVFGEALSSVYLQLSFLVGLLQKGARGVPVLADMVAADAPMRLRQAVTDAYVIASKSQHYEICMDTSRFNTFCQSVLIFADHMEDLTTAIKNAAVVQVIGEGGYRIPLNMTAGLLHHAKVALWDSWKSSVANIKDGWGKGAWKAMLRNVLAITSSAAFGLYWYQEQPAVKGYWVCITVVTLTTDTLGQSLLKGLLRILGVLMAWAFSTVIVLVSTTDVVFWLGVLFLFTFVMAYVQQDPVFGYGGASGLITFYVVGMQMFGVADPSLVTMAYRALTVTVGVVWSLLFFVAIFPLDGMRDPIRKLHEATDLCFGAYEILIQHGERNLTDSERAKARKLLIDASMAHNTYEKSKLHAGILYHLLGLFYRPQSEEFDRLNTLSQRIHSAIVGTRLLGLIGCQDVNRVVIGPLVEAVEAHLKTVDLLVMDSRKAALDLSRSGKSTPAADSTNQTLHPHPSPTNKSPIAENPPDPANHDETHVSLPPIKIPPSTQSSSPDPTNQIPEAMEPHIPTDHHRAPTSPTNHKRIHNPVAMATAELRHRHFSAVKAWFVINDVTTTSRDYARWDAFVIAHARASRNLAAISNEQEAHAEIDVKTPDLSARHERSPSIHLQLGNLQLNLPIPRVLSERFLSPASAKEFPPESIRRNTSEGTAMSEISNRETANSTFGVHLQTFASDNPLAGCHAHERANFHGNSVGLVIHSDSDMDFVQMRHVEMADL